MGRSAVGAAVGVGETTQVVFLGNLSPGSDPHDGTEIFHEDVPVPDGAGLRAVTNGFDHVRGQVIRGEHVDLHLGQKKLSYTQRPDKHLYSLSDVRIL